MSYINISTYETKDQRDICEYLIDMKPFDYYCYQRWTHWTHWSMTKSQIMAIFVGSNTSVASHFTFQVVPEGDPRCPDIHDLSECYHLYDLGRHVLTLRPLLTAKNLLPPTKADWL